MGPYDYLRSIPNSYVNALYEIFWGLSDTECNADVIKELSEIIDKSSDAQIDHAVHLLALSGSNAGWLTVLLATPDYNERFVTSLAQRTNLDDVRVLLNCFEDSEHKTTAMANLGKLYCNV